MLLTRNVHVIPYSYWSGFTCKRWDWKLLDAHRFPPEKIYHSHVQYRIAGNFRGRKLSRISRFFSHPRKFSPRNSRYAIPIMRTVLAFREMILSYRSAKVFSLENFPLYGIIKFSPKIDRNSCQNLMFANFKPLIILSFPH